MTAGARWRELEGRLPFVRGRFLAGAAAVLGSVLASPTVVWPVLRMSLPTDLEGPQASSFVQLLWSWGRYDLEGPALGQGPPINVVPAWTLALACLAGLLGGLAWLLRRGPDGRVLGAAGVGVALAVVGGYSLTRLGNVAIFQMGETTGFTVETLPAGRAESVASVLLLVALCLMLWRPLVGLGRSSGRLVSRVSAQGRQRATGDEAERARPRGGDRVRRAVLRDADPGGDEGSHTSGGPGDAVGFTDASRADDRFTPPM
jgi:hypothetical protein